jgi:hypothetical protein
MPAPATGIGDPIFNHPAMLASANVVFYWSSVGSKTFRPVSVTISDGITRLEAQTTLISEEPAVIVAADIDVPTMDDLCLSFPGLAAMHLGDYTIAGIPVPGITLEPALEEPPHATAPGQLAWIQVIPTVSSRFHYPGGTFSPDFWQSLEPHVRLLDSTYPYTAGDDFEDSPSQLCRSVANAVLTYYSDISHIDFSFKTTLMYRPDGVNTMYVPLYSASWGLHGTAIYVGAGTPTTNPADWSVGSSLGTTGPTGIAGPSWPSFRGNVKSSVDE